MNERKIFDTFGNAIEFIIDQLNDGEKELIRNGDPVGLHMALARWIKNDYVFSGDTNINELVSEKVRNEDPYFKNRPDEKLIIHPDNLSGIIIDELIKKLKVD